jgi:hypothetical protein
MARDAKPAQSDPSATEDRPYPASMSTRRGFSGTTSTCCSRSLAFSGNRRDETAPVHIIAVGALLIGCMLTPLFCWYVRQDGDAWIVNAAGSTIALPFWAYLIGAVAFANYHDGNLAAILVMSFTVVDVTSGRLSRANKFASELTANLFDSPCESGKRPLHGAERGWRYARPKTRWKIVSTWARWKSRSKLAASSLSLRCLCTSASALSNARKSPSPRQAFMALRCTIR